MSATEIPYSLLLLVGDSLLAFLVHLLEQRAEVGYLSMERLFLDREHLDLGFQVPTGERLISRLY